MSRSKVREAAQPVLVELPVAVGWPVTLAEVQAPASGPVRFHPSLRTAAQLNGPAAEQLPAPA